MTAPLYLRLKNYSNQNRISFAMPGHKNGRGLKKDLLALDVTELDLTENLCHPNKCIKESQALLSHLYNSDTSYILTGGSTAAIQSMICSATKSGSTILASGDSHMSVINTCTLLGINIRFFPKAIDNTFFIPNGTNSISEYLTDDISAVIITSPNYYGMCSNIKNIADECHKKNIPLIVDEAHGAHFVSSPLFPETATHFADAVCQSAHKTLNAMNGAAYLHVNGNLIDKNKLEKTLYMFQSSSPSYVIATSADIAREEIENGDKWEHAYEMCNEFKVKLTNTEIKVLKNDDATRLVLNFSNFDITGFEVNSKLSQKGIDIEMADLFNIVLIVTPSNTQKDIDTLYTELLDIVSNRQKTTQTINILPPPICTKSLSPQKAFFSKQTEVELTLSSGRLSCSTVVLYPPGVPVIYTGETIRNEQIEYIKQLADAGAEITGLKNGKITVSE